MYIELKEKELTSNKFKLNIACDVLVPFCKKCSFVKKCNALISKINNVLQEEYPNIVDDDEDLSHYFNGIVLSPYKHNNKTIFYVNRFGNIVLLQAKSNINPMDYPYQIHHAVRELTKDLGEEILVICDMKYYNSKNFELIVNKKTGEITIKE